MLHRILQNVAPLRNIQWWPQHSRVLCNQVQRAAEAQICTRLLHNPCPQQCSAVHRQANTHPSGSHGYDGQMHAPHGCSTALEPKRTASHGHSAHASCSPALFELVYHRHLLPLWMRAARVNAPQPCDTPTVLQMHVAAGGGMQRSGGMHLVACIWWHASGGMHLVACIWWHAYGGTQRCCGWWHGPCGGVLSISPCGHTQEP